MNNEYEKESGSSSNEDIIIQIKDEEIPILNVKDEDNLINDMENVFYNVPAKSNLDDENIFFSPNDNIYNQYVRCDSPITISNHGSFAGSSNNSDVEETTSIVDSSNNELYYSNKQTLSLHDIANITQQNLSNIVQYRKKRRGSNDYRKINIKQAETKFNNYIYNDNNDNNYTNELDILTTFLKGQKNVYIQSKNITQLKYNCIMIPTLLISCSITLFTPFISCDKMHTVFISGLNAIIALLISINKFLKLETAVQVFFTTANQFDKLETILELTNGKLLVIDNEKEKKDLVLKRINEIEEKIFELKDTNEFFIPEEVKSLFPIICHINIFSFIKKMQTHKIELIKNLQNIKNEINYIMHKWKKKTKIDYNTKNNNFDNLEYEKEKNRLEYLHKLKERIKSDIYEYRNSYSLMDSIFTKEIKQAENRMNKLGIFFVCFWNYIKKDDNNCNDTNSFIEKYIHNCN